MPKGKALGQRTNVMKARLAALLSFVRPSRQVGQRGCLYRLSAMSWFNPETEQNEKLYPGTDKLSYRSIKELIRTARMLGELEDDCFSDNKRILISGETNGWPNIAAFMRLPDPRHYERNHWQEQPNRIQVWVEKDTLRGLISEKCEKWDVTRVISMGTFGRTILVRCADRIAYHFAAGFKSDSRRLYIFYVGDFDPTGLAIEEWAQRGNGQYGNRATEGLHEILIKRHGWTEKQIVERIIFVRIAVTLEDFRNEALEPYKISIKDAGKDDEGRDKKGNDPRAADYNKLYGDKCLEADALEVLQDGEIASRLDAAIEQANDMDLWRRSENKQEREIRKWIRK
jgi:hypothetical protein